MYTNLTQKQFQFKASKTSYSKYHYEQNQAFEKASRISLIEHLSQPSNQKKAWNFFYIPTKLDSPKFFGFNVGNQRMFTRLNVGGWPSLA